MKLLSKLKLKEPIYEVTENSDGEEKWKCFLKIKNVSGIKGKGYNNKKKKAKSNLQIL